MKAFFHVVATSCLLLWSTAATSASIDAESAPSTSNDPAVGVVVNDGNASSDDSDRGSLGNARPSSQDADSLPLMSSSNSGTGSDDGTGNHNEETNASSGSHPRGSTMRHSTNYYDNNQNNDHQRGETNYDDEKTYLDLFGERAKELLTLHVVPSTDAECGWSWRTGRCEPYCVCGFHFLPGDYHLGRACRLRRLTRGENIAEETGEEASLQEAWQKVWRVNTQQGTKEEMPAEVLLGEGAATMCTPPPDSRYALILRQITAHLPSSKKMLHHYQKLKNATVNAAKMTKFKACVRLKESVQERARVRNQLVVLTRKGSVLLRWVCGAMSEDGNNTTIEEDPPEASPNGADMHSENVD